MAMIVNRRYHGGHNHHHHHHHQTVSMMTERPCMQKVWRPAVPLWEKEFCFKVGLFTWKRFVEAKKYTYLSENVMNWDDSAAEEAFLNARKRFRHINGLPWNLPIPSPDMFIDEIDWNSEPDPELYSGLESTTDDEGEVDYIDPYNEAMLINRSRIEDIKPTGWDVDVTEFSRPVLLTGLIVGDHSSISEDSSRIS